MHYGAVTDLCRLCATQNIDLNAVVNLSPVENPERRILLFLVNKYLSIIVTDYDSLPIKFCSECIQKLHSFDEFSQKCLEVQKMFTSMSNSGQMGLHFLESTAFDLSADSAHESKIFIDNDCRDIETIKDENDSNNDECALSLSWRETMSDERTESNPLEAEIADERTQSEGTLTIPPIQIEAEIADERTESESRPLIVPLIQMEAEIADERTESESSLSIVPPIQIEVESGLLHKDGCSRESSCTRYKTFKDKKINRVRTKFGRSKARNIGKDRAKDPLSENCGSRSDKTKLKVKSADENPSSIFKFNCHVCQEMFKNFNQLKLHCEEKHNESAFVYCICDKQLRSRTAIAEHQRKHTGTELFECNECGKKFNRRTLMAQHMIIHMPKDKQPYEYVCCKCAKRFNTYSSLRNHEKVHLPEEERFLVVCNICQKKFACKSSMDAHVRAVHYGEKPFVCEHCGNGFSSKANLVDHLTTHTEHAPWPCDVCGKNFKSKYRLNRHMDMHRAIKYRCPHCPMELSTRRTLRQHLLVHKEEKGYVCKVCSKAFRRSKDLRNHNNLHTGRRPYKCDFCGRTFANGSNCRAHKLRMHPDEMDG